MHVQCLNINFYNIQRAKVFITKHYLICPAPVLC